jgi:hypothetical protein
VVSAESEYDHLLSSGEAVDVVILIIFRMAVPPLGPQVWNGTKSVRFQEGELRFLCQNSQTGRFPQNHKEIILDESR